MMNWWWSWIIIINFHHHHENELNDEEIKKIPKETYKKMVKNMVNKAAFKEYLAKKETHKKIKKLEYEQLELQPYLKSKQFSGKERKLLTLLRSRCHPAKNNFKKMYQHNIKCNFGCNEDEDQKHTFMRYEPINKNARKSTRRCASKTCSNCRDCWDCRDCSYCSYCSYCLYCSFCLYCSSCS